jgi:hypothetical protein
MLEYCDMNHSSFIDDLLLFWFLNIQRRLILLSLRSPKFASLVSVWNFVLRSHIAVLSIVLWASAVAEAGTGAAAVAAVLATGNVSALLYR